MISKQRISLKIDLDIKSKKSFYKTNNPLIEMNWKWFIAFSWGLFVLRAK